MQFFNLCSTLKKAKESICKCGKAVVCTVTYWRQKPKPLYTLSVGTAREVMSKCSFDSMIKLYCLFLSQCQVSLDYICLYRYCQEFANIVSRSRDAFLLRIQVFGKGRVCVSSVCPLLAVPNPPPPSSCTSSKANRKLHLLPVSLTCLLAPLRKNRSA